MTNWTYPDSKDSPALQGFTLLIGSGYNLLIGSGFDQLIGGTGGSGWDSISKNATSWSFQSEN